MTDSPATTNQEMPCPTCGVLLPDEARFCGACGHVLTAIEPATIVTSAPTSPASAATGGAGFRTMVGVPAIPADALRAMGVAVPEEIVQQPVPEFVPAANEAPRSRGYATLVGGSIPSTTPVEPTPPAGSRAVQVGAPVVEAPVVEAPVVEALVLEAGSPRTEHSEPVDVPARTPEAVATPAPTPVRNQFATMHGMMAVPPTGVPAAAVAVSPVAVPVSAPAPVHNRFATMHGVAATARAEMPVSVPAPPTQDPASFRTVGLDSTLPASALAAAAATANAVTHQMPVSVPVALSVTPAGVAPAGVAPAGVAPAGVAPTGTAASAARQLQNTMAGGMPVVASVPAVPIAGTPQLMQVAVPPGMLGKAPPPSTSVSRGEVPSVRSSDDFDVPGLSKRRRKSSNALWLVLAGVAVLGGGMGLYMLTHTQKSAPGVQPPAVVPASVRENKLGGREMTFTLGAQPAGTVIRASGSDVPLAADGVVVLPLPPDKLGTIDIPFEIVTPDGAHKSQIARAVLAWTVRTDISKLLAPAPSIQLQFNVATGMKLFVNDHPVALDASGRGTGTLDGITPIGPLDPETLPADLVIRVEGPDGHSESTHMPLSLPRVDLTLDWPTDEITTTWDSITVRGTTHNAQRLMINTSEAPIKNGTFSASLGLPAPGDTQLVVTGFSDHARPVQRIVKIHRISEAQKEAFARLSAPTPAAVNALSTATLTSSTVIHAHGKLIGSPTESGGVPTFQFLVSDDACATRTCLVWANVPSGTKVSPGATELAGVVTTTRRWVSGTGEHRVDPVVEVLWMR